MKELVMNKEKMRDVEKKNYYYQKGFYDGYIVGHKNILKQISDIHDRLIKPIEISIEGKKSINKLFDKD